MRVVVPGQTPPRWDLYAGMPCWIELVTTEPWRARDFYAGLFGWEYEPRGESRGDDHVIAFRDGFPVASIRTAEQGASEWRLFLATADRAAVTRQSEELGATVTVPPAPVSGVGSKVVLKGPSEAEFGLLEPEDSWQFDVGLPGTLMWAELVTIKAQMADHFFGELFGYSSEQFGVDHQLDYSVWYLGDESVLARVSMIREHITADSRPHWLMYLGVDPDVGTEELVRRAIQLGGRVRVNPYDSSLGRAAVLRDPVGARFAIVDATQAPGDYASAANYDPYDD
ncbi:hypothetical protein FHX42_001000 [Saccharopolyspora lacisalsi]|uniref:VOC domain-containing protein n=1 Tax=Halosaccharopolyspora lacisalsi TaxID=1000566 RepID=A0A839DWU6_9PSEU|nr:VOC family protein [Halosaccharopolyspora lacisalsi]MBA8823671.1 hypothetical protein [Halosaccharopolyspora lacisalsi]